MAVDPGSSIQIDEFRQKLTGWKYSRPSYTDEAPSL